MNRTLSCASTFGWREFSRWIVSDVFSCIIGRTNGTGALTATSAKDARTSISAVIAETLRKISENVAATSTTRSTKCRCFAS